MVRLWSRAIGIVVTFAACVMGCAVQSASPEETSVDTADQSTANVVVPRVSVTVQDDPCHGANEPLPATCHPTSVGQHTNNEVRFGYPSIAPVVDGPISVHGIPAHPKE
jgi:hypothetical protein